MSVYVIVSTYGSGDSMRVAVERALDEGQYLKIAHNSWLVDYPGTTRELREKIHLDDNNQGIVFRTTGHSGHASPDIWEWYRDHPYSKSE